MEKDLGDRIVRAIHKAGRGLGELDSLVTQIADVQEKQEMVRCLGAIMANMSDMMRPILRQYPELDRDN
jgi:hypothetical protein